MNNHKSDILNELKSLTRIQIEARLTTEENTSVRIWIWQYLQTL